MRRRAEWQRQAGLAGVECFERIDQCQAAQVPAAAAQTFDQQLGGAKAPDLFRGLDSFCRQRAFCCPEFQLSRSSLVMEFQSLKSAASLTNPRARDRSTPSSFPAPRVTRSDARQLVAPDPPSCLHESDSSALRASVDQLFRPCRLNFCPGRDKYFV